jgi:hypothetical protein
MQSKLDQRWNEDVAKQIKNLVPIKQWLNRWIEDKATDWESQKSAHQALKLLDMAEYEMWNMQWFKDKREQRLYHKAEDKVKGK